MPDSSLPFSTGDTGAVPPGGPPDLWHAISRHLVDASRDGVLVFDTQGRIVDANPAICAALGYTREELCLLTRTRITPARWYAAEENVLRSQVRVQGVSDEYEKEFVGKDGRLVPASVRTWLLRDGNGRDAGAWCMVRDLRDRAAFETLSRTILQTAMDGFWIVDDTLRLLEVNDAYCRMSGYARSALLTMRVDDLDCVENERRLRARFDTVTPDQPSRYETRHRCRDGSILDVEVSVSTLPTAPRLLFAFVRDTTLQRAQEEEIVRSRQMLQAVLNHLPARIYWKDAEGSYLGCNRSFAHDAGFDDADDVIGRDDFEMRWQEQAETIRAEDRAIVESGEARFEREETQVDADGRLQWLRTSKLPMRDRSGAIVGVMGLYEDVTHYRRAEQELAKRAADLARSNRDLEQFADVASHDLQEPLRMVRSFVQMLADRYRGRLDDDADEFIGYAVDGAARMQDLIEDLLRYSRVGTGAALPIPTESSVALDTALENLRLRIEETGTLVTRGVLPRVKADPAQLVQLFQNLVSNAVKFRSEERPPVVHVSARRQPDGWEFSVADNGIGIKPEYFGRIFQVFTRLHARVSYPGTGIGLAICKRVVERHGGRVWVESVPREGSTFFFFLPDEPLPG